MKVNDIIVIGGGTAGCISALMLKTRFPRKNIKIIESKNVGIVGVGESSTEHWAQFCRFINIPQLASILECNGTIKAGVYFKGWADEDFMHSLITPHSNTIGEYHRNFAHVIANELSPRRMQPAGIWRNELSLNYFSNNNDTPVNQYHFDTYALNKYLHKVCIERGIDIIVDDLCGAKLHEESGEMNSVHSSTQEYRADFFIDCSGFMRLIHKKTYGIKWVSYSKYLPVNSAIAFATDEMEEYNKYTMATARNAGWSWTIPTQTRTGNGYVYCDGFIGKDEAQREMEEAYGQSLEVAKYFRFDPGRLEKAWHKNCYAVGLSQSFVEPLEATSIGSVIQQMFCFMHYLPSYDVDTCNQRVNAIFDNIVDYVQAHYLVKREDTPFWREVKYNLKLTPGLEKHLESWKNRLPVTPDFFCPWGMFNATNYIPVLYGLGWFDVDKIREEYINYGYEVGERNEDLDLVTEEEKSLFWISHKKLIKQLV